ncbi:MAG: UDP-N-acetylmuramoyl-tripeptide--D-alanyl-D-alanine ligase [Bacteroidales bacterium]|nr:UDP-N-acetylmuramoyl-tripeptide--D-alanyl-D-alanine ligase [Bacteroidales bacterium]
MTDLYSKYVECGYKVTTDSRAIKGGEIFFALKGENFDGNSYAMKALEEGASWAVVNDDADMDDDARLIRVPDPFIALKYLATEHRCNLKIPVIGLTGTNGKTTTKNLIAAVLARKYKVTATEGNLNNDIGVPLSLLKITNETEIAVIEMGANHPDDIAKLVKISQPDYGLITNVGKAHLLGFGSFEGVKAAKGELYRWLGMHPGSLIFLNADDPDLKEMAYAQACHVFEYGIRYQGAEVLPSDTIEPYLRIRLEKDIISTRLVGAYNATNVLAALAVGEYFGVGRKDAIAAIEGFVPANNRSQMVKKGDNTLIIDAYNANPSSMSAALDNFSDIVSDKKIVLLGDMRELGEDSLSEHVGILEKIEKMGVAAYLVGEEFMKAVAVHPCRVEGVFRTSPELRAHLESNPVHDALILVKGSRGIRMEDSLPF